MKNKFTETSFKVTEAEDVSSVICEKGTLRPHVVKARSSRYLIFVGDNKNFVEISEEVRLTVFCWDDIP
jgi:hypothetical protein